MPDINWSGSTHKQTDQLPGEDSSPLRQTNYEKSSKSDNHSESGTKQNCDPVSDILENTDPDNSDKSDEDDLYLSVDCMASIQLFRSLLSSMTGGDGRGHPDIERILAREPGTREDVMEATREYCQEYRQ